VLRGWCLDLARQAGASLEEDLARRDFRINALALPLADGAALVDPTGGLADLAAGELVAVREENLLADPLRLLRGVRLAAALGFRLEPRTWGWIRRHGERLATVAPERVLVEIEKLAACPGGGAGLALAVEAALLAPWQSGAEPQRLRSLSPERADGRGLAPAEAGRALALARMAVLFDADALQQLRSSRQLQRRCGQLRHWWLRLGPAAERLGELGEAERLSLHRQLEDDLPALLLLLPSPLARRWLERWRDGADPLFHPRPPLDGRQLQRDLGLAPSPRLGALLEHLQREAAFGRIGSAAEALGAARDWLERTTT
jgi:tRNA nucleotidyltransferase (CCA-adding enzyme)